MSDKTSIKIMEYVQDVEYNRQRLLAYAGTSENLSLTDAVTRACNKQIDESTVIADGPVNAKNQFRVRFFDIDGTLLQLSYVDVGDTIVPPQDPNYDPDYLVFERWASAKGNDFTDIQCPLDYAPVYYPKSLGVHLKIDLSLQDSDTVTFKLRYTPRTANLTWQGKFHNTLCIDWGDGTIDKTTYTASTSTSIKTCTHTYTTKDEYMISAYWAYINPEDTTDIQPLANNATFEEYAPKVDGFITSYNTLGLVFQATNSSQYAVIFGTTYAADAILQKYYALEMGTVSGYLAMLWADVVSVNRIGNAANGGGVTAINDTPGPLITVARYVSSYLMSGRESYIVGRLAGILDMQDVTVLADSASYVDTYNIRKLNGYTHCDLICVPQTSTTGVSISGNSSYGSYGQYSPICYSFLAPITSSNAYCAHSMCFTKSCTFLPHGAMPADYTANTLASRVLTYRYPEVIAYYGNYAFSNVRNIIQVTISATQTFETNTFAYATYLKDIRFTTECTRALNFKGTTLSKESWLNIITHLKDLTETTAQTITISCETFPLLKKLYYKETQGILELCSREEGQPLLDLLYNKNWTLSINYN